VAGLALSAALVVGSVAELTLLAALALVAALVGLLRAEVAALTLVATLANLVQLAGLSLDVSLVVDGIRTDGRRRRTGGGKEQPRAGNKRNERRALQKVHAC